jgi:hypothetical protein
MATVEYDIKKDGPRPADLNKDGKVTDKERGKYKDIKAENTAAAAKKPQAGKDQQDTITEAEMEQRFGFAKEVVWQNKELRGLFQKAIKEQWTDAMFQSQLRGSKWYENNADYARKAWAAEKTGGADWEAQMAEGEKAVEAWAVKNGASLTPEQKRAFARRYWFEGWNDPDRAGMMGTELSQLISTGDNGFMKGASGGIQAKLMDTARRNGLTYDQRFFEGAARSVAAGLTTEEDWDRDLRSQAATLWQPWSDKIMAGLDAQDLASGYINMMAQTMEVDADSISLHDPRLMKAITHVDDKGNAAPMGLYDFNQMLREDPAWMQTKQATDSVSSIGMDILRRFGFST